MQGVGRPQASSWAREGAASAKQEVAGVDALASSTQLLRGEGEEDDWQLGCTVTGRAGAGLVGDSSNGPISFCSSSVFIANLCYLGDPVLELACQIYVVKSSFNA